MKRALLCLMAACCLSSCLTDQFHTGATRKIQKILKPAKR